MGAGQDCSYYANLPDLNYDYIFIDGPTFRIDRQSKKCFNSDLINILNQNKNTVINGIIDQRILNYKTYKLLMPYADINYDVIRKLSFLRSISSKSLK